MGGPEQLRNSHAYTHARAQQLWERGRTEWCWVWDSNATGRGEVEAPGYKHWWSSAGEGEAMRPAARMRQAPPPEPRSGCRGPQRRPTTRRDVSMVAWYALRTVRTRLASHVRLIASGSWLCAAHLARIARVSETHRVLQISTDVECLSEVCQNQLVVVFVCCWILHGLKGSKGLFWST